MPVRLSSDEYSIAQRRGQYLEHGRSVRSDAGDLFFGPMREGCTELFHAHARCVASRALHGCYKLAIGRWWPWGFGEENSYVTPPSRVELLSEHGTKGFEQYGFLLRTMPRKEEAPAGSREFSYWQVRSSDQIDLIWTDGFTGVTLELEKKGDELSGWAHPHFDAVKLIPRTARVVARSIACDAP